jgi:hypothetical protein
MNRPARERGPSAGAGCNMSARRPAFLRLDFRPATLRPMDGIFKNQAPFVSVFILRPRRGNWSSILMGEVIRPLMTPDLSEPTWREQQVSPAEIELAESSGRVDRSSPGDVNNDGYNESRGSYMVVANGPRLALIITPRSTAIAQPILEISELPPGNVLVTVEGRLVEDDVRLNDGRLLVKLPGRIERPTSVNIRVQ